MLHIFAARGPMDVGLKNILLPPSTSPPQKQHEHPCSIDFDGDEQLTRIWEADKEFFSLDSEEEDEPNENDKLWKHFCINGFSSCDPYETYSPLSKHEIRVADPSSKYGRIGSVVSTYISSIISCPISNRNCEYSALITLGGRGIPVSAAQSMFPGFVVDEVEPKGQFASLAVSRIIASLEWKGWYDPKVVDNASMHAILRKCLDQEIERRVRNILLRHSLPIIPHIN